MSNPRDPVHKWGIPVNPFTGQPITEHQGQMLDELKAACRHVSTVLHNIEGSDPEVPHNFTTRRCDIAGTHLEELQLIAMRELLDK